ncbi:hypothetical protein N781_06155 [Pontibacillus halophilus JSM 076056 = DSM 19796]|uniref:Thiol-disulfide oxidoreductase n=1 Tax=Pontibacillus halophilus JSM 076056 = DSM 19796 TaxID=1385510 RepID=A0A0A5I547_9BACI|nr:DCC1-like thiol-disulfide oxidoreductase family protein [Pontibacillus halophilus]KGX90947.1 hypothetical protein N781_06155 [Pontibacillus halophilus JSM 076056 = DSM 19796]
MKPIVLFDGYCNFCNQSVQFILRRNALEEITFASLQGHTGKRLLKKHGVQDGIDSVVFIENGKAYTESSAALRIACYLSYPYKIVSIFLIVPPPIRNGMYRIIAKNRYKWFGKKEVCRIPTTKERARFLDD